MISFIKVFLLLTILMWQSKTGESLRCYICDFQLDPMCQSPQLQKCTPKNVQSSFFLSRYINNGMVDRPPMPPNATDDVFKCIFHRNDLRVSRFCVYKDVCYCKHNKDGLCLECKEDGCNEHDPQLTDAIAYLDVLISGFALILLIILYIDI